MTDSQVKKIRRYERIYLPIAIAAPHRIFFWLNNMRCLLNSYCQIESIQCHLLLFFVWTSSTQNLIIVIGNIYEIIQIIKLYFWDLLVCNSMIINLLTDNCFLYSIYIWIIHRYLMNSIERIQFCCKTEFNFNASVVNFTRCRYL